MFIAIVNAWAAPESEFTTVGQLTAAGRGQREEAQSGTDFTGDLDQETQGVEP